MGDMSNEDALDYASKRVGSQHVEDVVGGRAKCGICGYIDDADPEDPVVKEWHGDSFAEVEIKATVGCKFCHKQVPAETAHLHQGEWVGDECCWDERLRSTE